MYCAVYLGMRIGAANCRSHPLWLKKHFDKEQIGVRLSSQSSSTWLLSLRRVFGPSSTWTWFYRLALSILPLCQFSENQNYYHGLGHFCEHFWLCPKVVDTPSCFLRPRSGWTLKVFEELMDQSVSNFQKSKCSVVQHSGTQHACGIYVYRRCVYKYIYICIFEYKYTGV